MSSYAKECFFSLLELCWKCPPVTQAGYIAGPGRDAAAAAAKSLKSHLTLLPNGWQPTRLPCPWDSPGKNTGVGCHFPLQCMKVKSESEVAQSCPTLSDLVDCSLPGSSIHGIFQARVLEWGAIAFSDRKGWGHAKTLEEYLWEKNFILLHVLLLGEQKKRFRGKTWQSVQRRAAV